jgi:hypothetical protein
MVRTRAGAESFLWFTETCSTGTMRPRASYASNRFTYRPIFIT